MAGDARAKELIDLGNSEFTRRDPILSLWQEIAEQFYVERSDFMAPHPPGIEWASHLQDSYPVMLRRELGNSISSMLRPRDKDWFELTTLDDERDRVPENAAYLERVSRKVKRAIYDPRTNFIKTTKAADHDFVTFGQAVLSVEEYEDRQDSRIRHLLFRQHHLRDIVWLENSIGEIDQAHRRAKMSAIQMCRDFEDDVLAQPIKTALKKDPGTLFNIRCVVMPLYVYDKVIGHKGKGSKARYQNLDQRGQRKAQFIEVVIDADNCRILKENTLLDFPYAIPRWHLVSGSQYAYAPTTSIALPDARMMQQMARIILEAGEKAVDPPVVVVGEAVREVNLQAGGITWADYAFDDKIKQAVQPIEIENDMRVAFMMRQDMRDLLSKCWFIDKLTLPPASGSEKMTAEEVRVRTDEFIRNLLPLFEPMEIEYNTRVLDKAYTLLKDRMGLLPVEECPEDLIGADTSWTFESPVQVASRRQVAQRYQEMMGLLTMDLQFKGAQAQAAAGGAQQTVPVDLSQALKDAIYGVGADADWFKTDDEMASEQEAQMQAAQEQQMMQAIQGGALTAQTVADASKSVGEAMQPPPPQAPIGKPVSSGQKALPAPKKKAA